MSGVVSAAVTNEPLDAAALERAVLHAADGALVTFRGVIRDHDGGRGVTGLDYSAHPDAAAFLLAACDRAAVDGVTVAAQHRIGVLGIGDVALVAVAAAAHRAAAFAACAALVDDIKATVPIWKRQHHDDGTSTWQNL
ncbi:molybdenum cofactor biosynthesis protein MoaE [uncultured Amnibacterium sp.]|uniref:molybdenum cofactor biosynthesis protein MoaE n=1 Tax=uncultured Amnibacterium sp. TaxID=1631851 RepID=UPI0035CA9A49